MNIHIHGTGCMYSVLMPGNEIASAEGSKRQCTVDRFRYSMDRLVILVSITHSFRIALALG
jgi:DNA-binding sugar fermentation-stimulating protein